MMPFGELKLVIVCGELPEARGCMKREIVLLANAVAEPPPLPIIRSTRSKPKAHVYVLSFLGNCADVWQPLFEAVLPWAALQVKVSCVGATALPSLSTGLSGNTDEVWGLALVTMLGTVGFTNTQVYPTEESLLSEVAGYVVPSQVSCVATPVGVKKSAFTIVAAAFTPDSAA